MTPEDDKQLRHAPDLAKCVPIVNTLTTAGTDLDDAWLLAGALVAYTGNAGIPKRILAAVNRTAEDEDVVKLPRMIGQVNQYLRDGTTLGSNKAEFDALVTLFELIERLPDWDSRGNDPTRMVYHYDGIEEDYAEGNVVLMAEVGSVGRTAPPSATELYKAEYRLHFSGGLKDVTALNPEQKEVIYAPKAAYLVKSTRVGKVKDKKGGHAHTHVYLQHLDKSSEAFTGARAAGRVRDLGDPKRFTT